MPEKEPQRPSLTPEQQEFNARLENIEHSNLEEIYPPEVERHAWHEVTDETKVAQLKNKITPIVRGDFSQERCGIYEDESGEQVYLVRRFNQSPQLRNIQLDMLAAAKKIAPWAKQTGLTARPTEMQNDPEFGKWTYTNTLIQYDKFVLRQMVNGLGSPQNSVEQKQRYMREDIAAIVHENVHLNNTHQFTGERIIYEPAPMAAEYLAFPGKNEKMSQAIAGARKLLRSEQEEDDYYNDATLLGMLVMARDDELLPAEEDINQIEAGLAAWQEQVENLPPDELVTYRRKVEGAWLLSPGDEKLHAKLRELKQQYPQLLSRLLGDYQLKGE